MEPKIKRVRHSLIALGMIGTLMAAHGTSVVAQTPSQLFTLTVRPHEMATATRTALAGKQTLDGKPLPIQPSGFELHPAVYVPPQCVGTKRCPFVILVNAPEEFYIQIADKYGMILAHLAGADDTTTVALFNQEMEQVLRTFAIDPDKIAITGSCCWFGHRTTVSRYAAYNPNVFSLMASGTQEAGDPAAKLPNQRTEYLLAGGMLEERANFEDVRRLRARGYTVKFNFQFRGHIHTYEGYDFIGRWLQECWAIPNPAARPVPYTFGDPPVLTEEILAKMTVFWTRFMQEPDSIKTTARIAMLREVLIPVGKEQISSWMVNIAALAGKYPSVAAALSAAQLTPEQHEAYRAAFVSARVYQDAIYNEDTRKHINVDSVSTLLGIKPTSAVAKNLEFLSKHPELFDHWYPPPTTMWNTP